MPRPRGRGQELQMAVARVQVTAQVAVGLKHHVRRQAPHLRHPQSGLTTAGGRGAADAVGVLDEGRRVGQERAHLRRGEAVVGRGTAVDGAQLERRLDQVQLVGVPGDDAVAALRVVDGGAEVAGLHV